MRSSPSFRLNGVEDQHSTESLPPQVKERGAKEKKRGGWMEGRREGERAVELRNPSPLVRPPSFRSSRRLREAREEEGTRGCSFVHELESQERKEGRREGWWFESKPLSSTPLLFLISGQLRNPSSSLATPSFSDIQRAREVHPDLIETLLLRRNAKQPNSSIQLEKRNATRRRGGGERRAKFSER